MIESSQRTIPKGLECCVLLRLFAVGKPVTPDQLADSLGPLFIDSLNLCEDDWNATLDAVLATMKHERLISFASNQVTKLGQESLCESFDLPSIPTSERWTGLRNRLLIAKALGLPPADDEERKRLGTADGLRVAIMVQGYQLPISPFVRMSECLDELARQELAESTNTVPDFDAVFAREQVLSTRLMKGLPGKPERVLPMLLVRAVDESPESLRLAVLQNWVRKLNGVEAETPAESQFDLNQFSLQVQHAAQSVDQPRYGESKVFIQHVWDAFRKQSDGSEWSLAEFKERLVEANRENLLTLSRADLVGAMDRQLIESSEIRLPHATFHFLRLPSEP
ncbi:hypothetical protein [Thalassoroseus pseudoceratinae]|uniref:hypothetical protein n=1 Tax=Thalassoroseus pseudoceratinae TaxID=2713176 RepID=UPI00141E4372|nr:hypothetical protein [Thalassoroseus pseudoceratinae]